MNLQNLTPDTTALISEKLLAEAESVSGKKILEFGFLNGSPFKAFSSGFEYYCCIDKSDDFSQIAYSEAQNHGLNLIPYEEIGEDCYFGRFHLVYTIFGLHDRAHLADEIMRLRRLIIKQGKIVIIDAAENGIEDRFIKQMKLCGFSDSSVEHLDFDGTNAFLISAKK